jgi:hypothetical protein
MSDLPVVLFVYPDVRKRPKAITPENCRVGGPRILLLRVHGVARGFDLKCSSAKLEQTPRKEVIHPHLPVGIPCYDFTPVTDHSLVSALPKVRLPTSGAIDSHGVTGGVYKARERIHRSVLISDY